MTRRERLERRLAKREEWAAARRADAGRRFATADAATAGIPFGQPILVGHHSEKRHRAAIDKMARNMDAGCESLDMAKHHEQAASGIERQLDGSIFSDDADAIGQLEARIADLEGEQQRMKKVNAAHKRFLKDPASLDAADLSDQDKAFIRAYKPAYSWEPHPHPPYSLSNNNANIRRLRERIKDIQRRNERTAKAEAAGGVTIETGGDWCRVTFAEKPEREVIDALKAAGFRWGGGSWHGPTAKLPESVKAE